MKIDEWPRQPRARIVTLQLSKIKIEQPLGCTKRGKYKFRKWEHLET
jgi:hypothetical protein